MLVFSVKTSSLGGSFARSIVIGPTCRQATEKFGGSSKSLTQTLSFGDRRLNVVLMQPISSALAVPDRARKTQAATHNSFKCKLPCPPPCRQGRRRRSSRLRRHALVGELAPRLRGLLQIQPHAAQDMRRLGELDVAIVDHLETIAPRVEEIHEGAIDQFRPR